MVLDAIGFVILACLLLLLPGVVISVLELFLSLLLVVHLWDWMFARDLTQASLLSISHVIHS